MNSGSHLHNAIAKQMALSFQKSKKTSGKKHYGKGSNRPIHKF